LPRAIPLPCKFRPIASAIGAFEQMFGAFEQMFGANQQIRHAGGSDQQARNLAIKPCWQWRLRGVGMPKGRKAML